MSATVIDGKKIASSIYDEVSQEISNLGFVPKLAVILVGEDPASQIYVKKKREICKEIGIRSELHEFPSDTSEQEVIDYVCALGHCPQRQVDGILVQLPLPSHIDKLKVLNSIPPDKDVDCFNAENIGRLAQGTALLKPCTPSGILEILKYHKIPTQGKRVTIINRSQVVGQPLSLMLSQEPYNATVTVCHEHTENLFFHSMHSEIVITAVGKYPIFRLPGFTINQDSTVIDVAMNRIDGKLFGDVIPEEFEEAKSRAKFITPVPGGVGPLTVAMLMRNTLTASRIRRNIL